MIIIEMAQGTTEWRAEKLGKPSASRFDEIITTKGDVSKQREGYLYDLAAQITSGISPEGFTSAAMEEGTRREAESRILYEMVRGVEVTQAGVIYPDEWKLILCSPDGIINNEYGLELKNVLPKTQVKYLLAGTLPMEYFQQVQGSMYISGFDRWDFMSYSPGLPPLILEIRRDEVFIEKLANAVSDFCADLAGIVERLKKLA